MFLLLLFFKILSQEVYIFYLYLFLIYKKFFLLFIELEKVEDKYFATNLNAHLLIPFSSSINPCAEE